MNENRPAFGLAGLWAAMLAATSAALPGCRLAGEADAPVDPALHGRVLLAELAGELPPALLASRGVLLGSRDPDGNSLITPPTVGQTDEGIPPVRPGDPNGGPGLRVLQLYYWDHRADSPLADYDWHQQTFLPFLHRLRADSHKASDRLRPLHGRAMDLLAWLARQRELPAGLRAVGAEPPGGWPGHCLAELDRALVRGDLPGARLWADELAAALFALTDLHRWLEFLVDNQAANLAMQAACRDHFQQSNADYAPGDYVPRLCISRYAGGSLCVAAITNYVEVERQAECLFRRPDHYAQALHDAAGIGDNPLRAHVPPDLRAAFDRLCRALSPQNRATLEVAASLPFERSFVANMLFRTQTAGRIDALAEALARFDRRYPRAEVGQLMDMLVYRAGLAMSGIEWGDRYDPRLMEMAGRLDANDPHEALLEARRLQYGVYGDGGNYQGLVLTLRRALDTGKMDCIRASDLIAALLRNAGWPGFLTVRWCRGSSAHTVAAIESSDGARRRITVVDGLYPPPQAVGAWPEVYFTGHGSVYAVELNGRGLDSYLFLEGYILRGPNARQRFGAEVPYLPRSSGDTP